MAGKLGERQCSRTASKIPPVSESNVAKAKVAASHAGYQPGLGTPQILDARVNREEIRLFCVRPRVGATAGYSSTQSNSIWAMLPNLSATPARRNKDDLDHANLGVGPGGYEYA